MGAVGMLAWSEIRRRWRGVVVLTLLVGFVGAVVLSTVAGARRTDSALARFNAFSRSSDVELQVGPATAADLRAYSKVPGVGAFAVLKGYWLDIPHAPISLAMAAAVDAGLGTVVDRARLISGRRADLSKPDEITMGEGLAAELHVRPGDHLDMGSYSVAQVERVIGNNGDPGPPAGPRIRLHVVGIDRRPLDLGDRGAQGGVVILTPAFIHKYGGQIFNFGSVLRIRTVHGSSDVPGVVAAARRIFPPTVFGFSSQPLGVETEGARSAIGVLTVGLWVLAGVAAAAGLVAIGIVLSREVSLLTRDQATLRALGLTRSQRVLVIAPGALLIAGVGTLLAALGAALASPLFPIGVARRAEPDPGLHLDWPVLTAGAIVMAVVVVLMAFIAALRSARRLSADPALAGSARPSTVVDAAINAGLPPTATNGLRMALEPGRGPAAVPVRSAFFGAVAGVLGLVAVLMFTSSVDHLAATPRLYGSTWDFELLDATNVSCGRTDVGLRQVEGVGAVASICYQDIDIDGSPVTAWSFDSLRGTIEPEVVEGHTPRGPHEIALGAVTLDALGKHIGDTVRAHGLHAQSYRIVGRIVLTQLDEAQPLADGATVTRAGFAPIYDRNNSSHFVVGRFAPGAEPAVVRHRIAAELAGSTTFGLVPHAGIPPEIDHLQQAGGIPPVVAALLVVLALIALGHTLVTAVRRRRRELALLKTLGFDRGQVRATVAWQATTIGAVGLLIGIPVGLVLGRVVWGLVANGLGVSTAATIPVLGLALMIPATLALVNLVAFFPARAAADTRVAVTLRSE